MSTNFLLTPCIIHKVMIRIVAANMDNLAPWYNSSMTSSKTQGSLYFSFSIIVSPKSSKRFIFRPIIRLFSSNIFHYVYDDVFKLFFQCRGGVGMGWGLINSLECALNHAQHTQPCINCPSCGLEGLLNYCSHLSPNESLTPSPSILQMSVLFQFLVGDILFLEKRTLNSYFAFAAWAMKSFQFIQCGPFLLPSP